MEYMVLQYTSREDLASNVEKACDAGWRPQGGVAVAAAGGRLIYVQAIILEEGSSQPED